MSAQDEFKKAPAWFIAGVSLVGMVLMAIIVLLSGPLRAQGTGSGGGAGAGTVVDVSEKDFKITIPEKVTAGKVSFQVANTGPSVHDLEVTGVGKTDTIAAGASATLNAGQLEPGTYKFRCTIAGHEAAGMAGQFEVVKGSDSAGEGAQGTPAADSAGADESIDWQAMDAQHKEVVDAFLSGPPAQTKGKGGEDLQPRMEGDTKVFEMTAEVVDWEVAPGKTVKAWTYNGAVPGPTLRANKGDHVKVILHNSLPESTSIHFHGLITPNAQDGVTFVTQDPIRPGETYTYEFTLENEGSHMYHSHHNSAEQVPLGLLGAFIVGPPPVPVDQEYTEILTDGPLGFGINGKGFPATAPIVAQPGQRTLVRFMNEGLIIHPMHLHGQTMQVVAKDGNKLAVPYDIDTLNIAPGERYDVVVTNSNPGAWAFHCHILSHAESAAGLHGMTTVWVNK
ncbi:MAG: multicopper oxidase domain-containing protein [Acidimicrobiia bacterium]|nr:multicopper oxidase domain-containing protein [Acidimicrobiia bacterium]